MNGISRFRAFAVGSLFVLNCVAQDLGPDELVRKATDEVLAAIKSDKQKALALAEEKVLPLVDFDESTRLAVGHNWNRATPEQKRNLVAEFRRMLVRTYSYAIEAYQGQTLKVLPSRGKQDPEGTTVRTQFVRAGGQPLSIEFEMRKTDASWRIYDITVGGVSLVITYRSEFDAIVKQSGIDGLIKRLAEKNAPAKAG